MLPKVSSHGKAYVYAVDHLTTGLLFGAPKDDFDFRMDCHDDGTPVVYECYPHAFEQRYQGRSCSVYEIGEAGFQRGVTGWAPELVCEAEVAVLRERPIADLYRRLIQEERQGNLILHRYEDTPEYKKLVSEHIVDRLIRFDALDLEETDPRFQIYYSKIVGALRSVMDGHLL